MFCRINTLVSRPNSLFVAGRACCRAHRAPEAAAGAAAQADDRQEQGGPRPDRPQIQVEPRGAEE